MSANSLFNINKYILLAVILFIGIGGGYLSAYSIYQPKINYYINQIDILTSEDTNLTACIRKINEYNNQIDDLTLKISNLTSVVTAKEMQISEVIEQITILESRVKILYGNITIEQAEELIETTETLTILDVRTVEEFDEGHIDGSRNIPLNELKLRIEELDKDDEILLYCRLGVRSSKAMKILTDHNFLKIYNLLGGIEAWIQSGNSIIT